MVPKPKHCSTSLVQSNQVSERERRKNAERERRKKAKNETNESGWFHASATLMAFDFDHNWCAVETRAQTANDSERCAFILFYCSLRYTANRCGVSLIVND
jgi:hypothetical protein